MLAHPGHAALMDAMKRPCRPQTKAPTPDGCMLVQVNSRGLVESATGNLDVLPTPGKGASAYDVLRLVLNFPEHSLEAVDMLNDILERQTDVRCCEAGITAQDGGHCHQVILAPLRVNNQPGAMLWIIDMTHGRRVTKSLEDDVRRLRAIFDHEPQCVKITDLDGHLLEMNPAGLRIIEADSISQVRGLLAADLVHPDDKEVFDRLQEECRTGTAARGVFRIRGIKGGVRWVETNTVPLRDETGAVVQLLAVTHDITARKNAEERLRNSAARFERQRLALVNLMRSGILQTDDLGQTLRDMTAAIAGCMMVERVSVWRYHETRRSIICLDLYEQTTQRHSSGQELPTSRHPSYFRAMEQDDLIAANRACEDPRTCELAEGYLAPLGIGAMLDTPLHAGGALVGVLCLEHVGGERVWTEDEQSFAISLANLVSLVFAQWEHRQAAQKLSQQASLLDLARDAILVCDLDHRITYWNKSAERLYGWTAEQAMGKKVTTLLYKDDATFLTTAGELLSKGEHICESRQITMSGGEVIVEGHWTLVRDEQGLPRSIMAINTDITAKKKAEEQMRRAQRLECIGTLAGGIAHDLNNVLTPILVSIDLLKQRLHEPAAAETLDIVETAAKRGANLIRQILGFARGGVEGSVRGMTLHALLDELDAIIRDTFPKNIRPVFRAAPDLWPLTGDDTRIHQMLLNLCVNARDAMTGGGTLTVEAENVQIDAIYAAGQLEANPGPYVRITVQDEGTGIPGENIEKIFDPFFTTKEAAGGTGLGLATTLVTVKDHGGFIEVASKPGCGTQFRIHLPAQPDAENQPRDERERDLPRGANQLVLVVDDELPVREITCRTLEDFGYRVLQAAHGAEAASLYARHRDGIDVVLTDMIMPVMDGASTIRVIRKIDPDARVIACSGVNSRFDATHARNCGADLFLPKPYDTETLLRCLLQVLQHSRPPSMPPQSLEGASSTSPSAPSSASAA